jgi:hypothetical protein
MNLLNSLWAWLRRLFTRKLPRYRTVVVEDTPEHFLPRHVYLVGENGHFWCAAMLCPCGCQVIIQLNLLTSTRPAWRFVQHPRSGALTFRPSVWRTQGCRSHFFLRDGRVHWLPRTVVRSADSF